MRFDIMTAIRSLEEILAIKEQINGLSAAPLGDQC